MYVVHIHIYIYIYIYVVHILIYKGTKGHLIGINIIGISPWDSVGISWLDGMTKW